MNLEVGTIAIIETTLTLVDNMTPVLTTIRQDVGQLIGRFHDLQNISGNLYVNMNIDNAINDLSTLQQLANDVAITKMANVKPINIPVSANIAEASSEIESLEDLASRIKISFPLEIEADAALNNIANIVDSIEDIEPMKITPVIDADAVLTQASDISDSINNKFMNAVGDISVGQISLETNIDTALSSLNELQDSIHSISSKEIDVLVSTDNATERLSALEAKEIDISINIGNALEQLSSLESVGNIKLDPINLEVNTDSALSSLHNLQESIDAIPPHSVGMALDIENAMYQLSNLELGFNNFISKTNDPATITMEIDSAISKISIMQTALAEITTTDARVIVNIDSAMSSLSDLNNRFSVIRAEIDGFNNIDISTQVSVATVEAGKLSTAIGKLPSGIDGATQGFKGWGFAIIVANQALELAGKLTNKIKSAIGEVISTAKENTEINTMLGVVLSRNAQSIDEARANYERLNRIVAETAQLTGLQETSLNAGAAELATFVKDAEALEQLMRVLPDYAAGMTGGIDVSAQEMTNLATQLGKVTMGAFDGMTKKGFEFNDAQKEILKTGTDLEKVAVISDVIGESWGGLAQAIGETPLGSIGRMENAMANVQHEVGRVALAFKGAFAQSIMSVLPPIDTIKASIGEFTTWFVDEFGNTFAQITGYIGGTISIIGRIAGAGFQLFKNMFDVVVNVFSGIASFINQHVETIVATFALAGTVLSGVFAIVAAKAVISFALMAKSAVFAGLAAFKAWMLGLGPISLIILAVVAVIGVIVALAIKFEAVGNVINTIIGGIVGAIFSAWEFIMFVGQSIGNFFIGVWEKIYNFSGIMVHNIKNIFAGLKETVLGIVLAIINALNKIPGVKIGTTGLEAGIAGAAATRAEDYAVKEFERIEITDWDTVAGKFNRGFEIGENALGNAVDGLKSGLESIKAQFGAGFDTGADMGAGFIDGLGGMLGMDDMLGVGAGGVGGGIEDGFNFAPGGALRVTDSGAEGALRDNLRLMVDIATRRYASEHKTQPNVTITPQINNPVIHNMHDYDQIVDRFSREIGEEMMASAAIG